MKIIVTNILTGEESSWDFFSLSEDLPFKELTDEELYMWRERTINNILSMIYQMSFPYEGFE